MSALREIDNIAVTRDYRRTSMLEMWRRSERFAKAWAACSRLKTSAP